MIDTGRVVERGLNAGESLLASVDLGDLSTQAEAVRQMQRFDRGAAHRLAGFGHDDAAPNEAAVLRGVRAQEDPFLQGRVDDATDDEHAARHVLPGAERIVTLLHLGADTERA